MRLPFFSMFFVVAVMFLPGCRSEKTALISPENQIVDAVANNDVGKLRALLSESPELLETVKDGKTTLLHYAAKASNDPTVVQTLLDFGADLNARDGKNWPPVYYAMYYRNKSATVFLLRQNVDASSYPDTNQLIEQAVRWNADVDALKILLDKHDEHWLTTRLTLDAARYNDDPEVMRLILERGGDPNATTDHVTVMHYAAGKSSSTKTLKYLLEYHAKIDTRQPEDYDNPGLGTPNTPLHYAAKGNPNVEISQWLIEHGADPYARNSSGETPCDYAIRYNPNINVVRFYFELLEENKKSQIDKQKLLKLALSSPCDETFPFLVRRFLEPDAVRGTPLSQYMPFWGQMDERIWGILLECGADLYGKNPQGKTAFDIAEQYDQSEMNSYTEDLKRLEKHFSKP